MKLFILIIILSVNLFAQTAEFTEAKGSATGETDSFSKWNFEIGLDKFEIRDNGRSKKINNKKAAKSFLLPLSKNEMLEILYFASYKKDLIFVYGAKESGYGIGYISSFNPTTLKLKWKAIINGFNVGKGLIENQFAYLTAIGFVGKIDLLTGKYVWKHDNLYRKYKKSGAFNFFEVPEIEGNTVIFSENVENLPPNILVINKTSGKILQSVVN
ncbi:MAG TPA: hypothetical protein PKY82_17075 [Pyrinomonadaceae bacterium]|nr:hypothetical protein [Pyrinomonadaceae bacterium]